MSRKLILIMKLAALHQ